MIGPLAGGNKCARGLLGPDIGGGPAVTFSPVAFAALMHRLALDRADRAHAFRHLSAPARRSIWARISSI